MYLLLVQINCQIYLSLSRFLLKLCTLWLAVVRLRSYVDQILGSFCINTLSYPENKSISFNI